MTNTNQFIRFKDNTIVVETNWVMHGVNSPIEITFEPGRSQFVFGSWTNVEPDPSEQTTNHMSHFIVFLLTFLITAAITIAVMRKYCRTAYKDGFNEASK